MPHPDVTHTTPGWQLISFIISLMNFAPLIDYFKEASIYILLIYPMVWNVIGLKISYNCFKMAVWFLAVSFWPVYFILYFPLTRPPRVTFQANILCTTLVPSLIKIMPPPFSKTQATGQFKNKKQKQKQTKIRQQCSLEIHTEQSTLDRCYRHLNIHTFV